MKNKELQQKIMSGRMPVVQIELDYFNIDLKDIESGLLNKRFTNCEMEESNCAIDWFECPACEKITYVIADFDPTNNIFEEMDKVDKQIANCKCVHCNQEFEIKDDGFLFVKQVK
jgi:transcription elongation factor Elf1